MPHSRAPGGARGHPSQRIRVLIADDHQAFAEALRTAMGQGGGIVVVGTAGDGDEAVELTRSKHPDIVLMDVEMPRADGIAATRRIREMSPETRVIILSAHDDDRVVAESLEAGAAGFLSKSTSIRDVTRSVKAAYRGEPLVPPDEARRIVTNYRRQRRAEAEARGRVERLTPREIEILQRMAEGLPPAEIAASLAMSPNTLRTHVQNILFRLRVHSKVEALATAIRMGVVRAGQPT